MKMNLKLSSAMIALLIFGAASCSDDSTSLTSKRTPLVDQLLNIKAFTDLAIPHGELDLNNPVIGPWEKGQVVILRYLNNDKKFVFAYSEKSEHENKFVSVVIGEYQTSASIAAVEKELRAGKFTGVFTITNSIRQVSLYVENGKFVKNEISHESPSPLLSSGRSKLPADPNEPVPTEPDCDMVSAGVCAATRIEQMNGWDYFWCVAEIAICWPSTVVSCYIDDCVVNPLAN
jgi:hypothetical protein